MAGPWDKFADPAPAATGPWAKFGGSPKEPPIEKPAAAPKADPSDPYGSVMKTIIGGGEAAWNMASGAIAKPVSDVMGMAAMAKDSITGAKPDDRRAEGFKNEVQDRLTYEPRTAAGKAIAKYNPAALVGKGVDAVGGAAGNMIGDESDSTWRRALGGGVHEAVNQLPALVGSKGAAIGAAAKDTMRAGAERSMRSALKPSLAVEDRVPVKKAVDTLLEDGINVSRGGAETLRERVGNLNSQISTAIQNSNVVIDKRTVQMRLNQVFKDFENQVNPTSDIVAIQKAFDDFDKHPLITGNKIPVQQAQEMKQGTYRSLKDKAYGELKGADIEAQKALARGLKEKIAQAVPDVRALNAEESKMLNALPMVERALMRDANKNLVGLGWITTDPAKMAGWMADRSPLFKSLIARMLNQGSKAAPGAAKMLPLGGIAATQSANEIPPPPPQ